MCVIGAEGEGLKHHRGGKSGTAKALKDKVGRRDP